MTEHLNIGACGGHAYSNHLSTLSHSTSGVEAGASGSQGQPQERWEGEERKERRERGKGGTVSAQHRPPFLRPPGSLAFS